MFRYMCTDFSEKEIPVFLIKPCCHRKVVIYKVVRSVAESLLRLSIKDINLYIQLNKTSGLT